MGFESQEVLSLVIIAIDEGFLFFQITQELAVDTWGAYHLIGASMCLSPKAEPAF